MKVIKINNKDYVLKFTSKAISELNSKGITLNSLIHDLESMVVNNLYEAFMHGLKTMQHDMTQEKAFSIIDEYFEESEENDMEKFFYIVLEEYARSLGLGKKFRELIEQQKME